MPDHRALPRVSRVEAPVVRFATDGRRIEQQLGAQQHHRASTLRIPLVPADAHPDTAESGIPYPEARISRSEVEFFHVSRAVRDVALAVIPEHGAVGVDHGEAVVRRLSGALEVRHGDDHAEFARQRGHARDGRMALEGAGAGELCLVLVRTEIRPFEELAR
jgi:hypothetical protein